MPHPNKNRRAVAIHQTSSNPAMSLAMSDGCNILNAYESHHLELVRSATILFSLGIIMEMFTYQEGKMLDFTLRAV